MSVEENVVTDQVRWTGKSGKPANLRKARYQEKFGVSDRKIRLNGTPVKRFLDQLDLCADDSARRLLLGVSEKEG